MGKAFNNFFNRSSKAPLKNGTFTYHRSALLTSSVVSSPLSSSSASSASASALPLSSASPPLSSYKIKLYHKHPLHNISHLETFGIFDGVNPLVRTKFPGYLQVSLVVIVGELTTLSTPSDMSCDEDDQTRTRTFSSHNQPNTPIHLNDFNLTHYNLTEHSNPSPVSPCDQVLFTNQNGLIITPQMVKYGFAWKRRLVFACPYQV